MQAASEGGEKVYQFPDVLVSAGEVTLELPAASRRLLRGVLYGSAPLWSTYVTHPARVALGELENRHKLLQRKALIGRLRRIRGLVLGNRRRLPGAGWHGQRLKGQYLCGL